MWKHKYEDWTIKKTIENTDHGVFTTPTLRANTASIHSKTRKDTLTAWARPQDLKLTRLKTWEFVRGQNIPASKPHTNSSCPNCAFELVEHGWAWIKKSGYKQFETLTLSSFAVFLWERLDVMSNRQPKAQLYSQPMSNMQLVSPERRLAPQVFQESVVPISALVVLTAYLNLPGTTGRLGGLFCSNHLLLELPLTDQKRKKKQHVNTATDTLQWVQGIFWDKSLKNHSDKQPWKERPQTRELRFEASRSGLYLAASTPQLSLTGPFSIIWQKLHILLVYDLSAASEPIANIFLYPIRSNLSWSAHWVQIMSVWGGHPWHTSKKKQLTALSLEQQQLVERFCKALVPSIWKKMSSERTQLATKPREPHLMRHLTHMLRPLTKLGDEFHNLAHSLKP